MGLAPHGGPPVRWTHVTPAVVLSADRPGVRRPPRWKRTEVHRIRAAHAGSDPRRRPSPRRSVYDNDYWFRVGQGRQMGFVHEEFIVPDGYVEHC